LRAARKLHERQNRAHLATARTSRARGVGQRDRAPTAGAAGPAPPAMAHGRQLWACSQRTRIQTLALASAVAATDPGLADCGGAKRETAPAGGRKKGRDERSGGSAGVFSAQSLAGMLLACLSPL